MANDFKFGESSTRNLRTCTRTLQQVLYLGLKLSKYDFGVDCGLRTVEEQRARVAAGDSLTLNSKHLPDELGESQAFDIKIYVNGKITWDKKYFRKVAGAIFKAAFILGIEIEWGGHWENLNDMPHFQRPTKRG